MTIDCSLGIIDETREGLVFPWYRRLVFYMSSVRGSKDLEGITERLMRGLSKESKIRGKQLFKKKYGDEIYYAVIEIHAPIYDFQRFMLNLAELLDDRRGGDTSKLWPRVGILKYNKSNEMDFKWSKHRREPLKMKNGSYRFAMDTTYISSREALLDHDDPTRLVFYMSSVKNLEDLKEIKKKLMQGLSKDSKIKGKKLFDKPHEDRLYFVVIQVFAMPEDFNKFMLNLANLVVKRREKGSKGLLPIVDILNYEKNRDIKRFRTDYFCRTYW
ncbi:MAG: hypothetical protein ABIG20_05415 [archaeon]